MKVSVMKTSKADFAPVEVDNIKTLSELILKEDYSLGTFADNHRDNEKFKGSHFVGLDFDGGLSLGVAAELFSDFEHIIATTRNHQKDKGGVTCDRFRVILKAEKFIERQEDFKATVLSLMEQYPAADKACSDAARMFYKSNQVVSLREAGFKVPVKKYVKPEVVKAEVAPYMKGQVSLATMKFITFGDPVNWNHSLFCAAKNLQEQQYDIEQATALLEGAARNYEGALNAEDKKTIESAFKDEPKYGPKKAESMFEFKHPTEMSTKGADVEWFVDGAMAQGAISILAGSPKSGKSTLTRQLSIEAARGGEWLGRKVKQTPVLYLALEEQEGMLKKQLTHLGLTKEDKIYMHCGRPFPGNVKENLINAIRHYQAGLVIIDTLLLLSTFSDINNYNEAYNQLNPFREVARETNAHILMIHHTNKSGTMMGSQGLLGAVDCGMTLANVLGTPNKRKISSLQRGGRPFTDCMLEYNQELDMYFKSVDQKGEFA